VKMKRIWVTKFAAIYTVNTVAMCLEMFIDTGSSLRLLGSTCYKPRDNMEC